MLHKEVTQQIIDAAKAVYAELGGGLPAPIYRAALLVELRAAGLAPVAGRAAKLQWRGEAIGEVQADLCVGAVMCGVHAADEVGAGEYGKARAAEGAGA